MASYVMDISNSSGVLMGGSARLHYGMYKSEREEDKSHRFCSFQGKCVDMHQNCCEFELDSNLS